MNKILFEKSYEWTIKTIPSQNNAINKHILRMNKWGNLPYPFTKVADINREKIKKKLTYCTNINFAYDFYLLYGNISGQDLILNNAYILDYAPVIFGKGVKMGRDVKIITSTHDFGNFDKVIAKPIFIGENVWLTLNIVVLPGVSIGKNCIIGAGSIVTKDIPDNVLAAGNPARIIKSI